MVGVSEFQWLMNLKKSLELKAFPVNDVVSILKFTLRKNGERISKLIAF